MSGSSRRGSFALRQPPVVDIGCNCRRPKLFSLLSSSFRGGGKPKSPNASCSSASMTTAFTATTTGGGTTGTTTTEYSSWGPASYTNNSLYEEEEKEEMRRQRQRRQRQRRQRRRRARGGEPPQNGRVAMESVAVAVESAEPYEDFRESMVQMVVEKEIYAWDDLNDLLHQFLSLNSPRHHPLILHAFADLWTRNGLFSPPSPICHL